MISTFHARAIRDTRGAKLVACFDAISAAAERFGSANGCRHYDRLAAFLSDPDLDVVTIATPSGAHLQPAVAAARAGKHVIVEKPLEVTLARCDRIIEACRENHVKLSTVFFSRFHQPAIDIKQAIDAGRFGRLTMGDAYVKWFRPQSYYDSGAWRGTWELDGGGALMNQAIHSVDLLSWLMGPVVEISAMTTRLAHQRIAVEDVAVANLKFANGALGVLEASTAVFPGYLKRIEIHGDQGSAVMEEEDIKVWDFVHKDRRDPAIRRRMQQSTSSGGGASDPAAIGHHGHARQFRDVVTAIQEDRAPAIDGPEGRKSVEIILGVYKSAETGRAIKLPLSRDPVLKARKQSKGN
jgi:predicted dehydrogenase